jgi:alpha-galactosidase
VTRITRFSLRPGEIVRTPLIAILFWQGDDVVRSQNLWRRWYRSHVLPKTIGMPQGPIKQIQVGGGSTEEVEQFVVAGIKPDVCWRDAGGSHTWYPSRDGPYGPGGTTTNPEFTTMGWLNTGTWELDREKYPQGFRPFSDWCRGHGMQFLLWFEPERVGSPMSWLATMHREWLLPGTNTTVGDIFELGNPAARAWLIDHLDRMIKTEGIDWYREDMNGGGPLPAWRNHDGPDRQGITENLYVQGHLQLWDETLTVRLRGLDESRSYRVVDFDRPVDRPGSIAKPSEEARTGHQLMTEGITIALERRGSAVLRYVAILPEE